MDNRILRKFGNVYFNKFKNDYNYFLFILNCKLWNYRIMLVGNPSREVIILTIWLLEESFNWILTWG